MFPSIIITAFIIIINITHSSLSLSQFYLVFNFSSLLLEATFSFTIMSDELETLDLDWF